MPLDRHRIFRAFLFVAILLYHQLFFCGATEEEMVGEIESRFDGEVISGRDLGVY